MNAACADTFKLNQATKIDVAFDTIFEIPA